MILERLQQFSRQDRVAIGFFPGAESLSYSALWERSSRLAGALAKTGVGPNEVVLIFLPLSADAIVAFVGTMFHGAIPSFMPLPSPQQDPAQYWSSHATLFRQIETGWLVAPASFERDVAAFVPGSPLRFLALETLLDGPRASPRPGQTAFLQHSSGTTGLKKGVVIAHEQLARQLDAYAPSVELDADSKIVSWLPLYHDMGLIACMLLPLYAGCQAVYVDTFKWSARPRLLVEAIDAVRGTHVWMPNFAFIHMANVRETIPAAARLSSMKRFVNCSEACKEQAFKRFLDAYSDIGVTPAMLTCSYAMAEAVFALTQTGPGPVKSANGLLSSGPLVGGVEARIVRDDGTVAGRGEAGQIEIRGEFVFKEYFKDRDRTQEAFRGEWYRTRDLGFIIDGELYVDGRTDDMIVVNGRNIFAHEVEAEIGVMHGVMPGRVVAFGCEDAAIGTSVLIVVCETGETEAAARQALRREIAQRLDDRLSVVPRDVLLVGPRTILKTTSGKLDRKTNKLRYLAGELASWK